MPHLHSNIQHLPMSFVYISTNTPSESIMWPNGYYFQRKMFYSAKWTIEMEKTFVNSLVQHARLRHFRIGHENCEAIQCALRAVNRLHKSDVFLPVGVYRVNKLEERYQVFMWLVAHPDVIWNENLRYVTVPDHVWREICKENKLVRCYVNAYEDLLEELSALFGPRGGNEEAPEVEAAVSAVAIEPVPASPPAPEVSIIVIDGHEEAVNDVVVPKIALPSSSFDDTKPIWNIINEYYEPDSDADSVLPQPGFPPVRKARKMTSSESSPSGNSQGPASSSASNATPIKKKY